MNSIAKVVLAVSLITSSNTLFAKDLHLSCTYQMAQTMTEDQVLPAKMNSKPLKWDFYFSSVDNTNSYFESSGDTGKVYISSIDGGIAMSVTGQKRINNFTFWLKDSTSYWQTQASINGGSYAQQLLGSCELM